MSKCEHPKCGFKWLIGTANDHQTEMRERTPDEKKDCDEQRQQDDHCDRADSYAGHPGKTVILIRKQSDGLETERKQRGHNPAHGSTDERVD